MRSALPTTLDVALVNVPVKVGPIAWAQCYDLAADRARRGVFCLNECLTAAQRRVYRDRARRQGHGWYGLRAGNAVFWDKARWKRVSAEVVELHARGESVLARRWPGFNSARTAVVVVLEDRETGEQVTVICTHWAPQGRKVPPGWGTWARAQARKQVRKIAAGHMAAGRPTLVMGDLNVKGVVRMALKGFRWLRRLGVDKIGLGLPTALKYGGGWSRSFKAPTDHKRGHRARMSWRTR